MYLGDKVKIYFDDEATVIGVIESFRTIGNASFVEIDVEGDGDFFYYNLSTVRTVEVFGRTKREESEGK